MKRSFEKWYDIYFKFEDDIISQLISDWAEERNQYKKKPAQNMAKPNVNMLLSDVLSDKEYEDIYMKTTSAVGQASRESNSRKLDVHGNNTSRGKAIVDTVLKCLAKNFR